MWKKVLAAGSAVLALGLVAPITSDYSYTGVAMADGEFDHTGGHTLQPSFSLQLQYPAVPD